MYVACACLNLKVHLAPYGDQDDHDLQAARWRLALAGVVAELPLIRTKTTPGESFSIRSVACANCDTTVYQFRVPSTRGTSPADNDMVPQAPWPWLTISEQALHENQAEQMVLGQSSYSPVYRFIIDYQTSLGPTHGDVGSLPACLHNLPLWLVTKVENIANHYLRVQCHQLAGVLTSRSRHPVPTLQQVQQQTERDAIQVIERLHQLVIQGTVEFNGPPCQASSLRIIQIQSPTQSATSNPTTAFTTEGEPDNMLRSLPRRGSAAASMPPTRSLMGLVDPHTNIPLPPSGPEGRTDDELAALSVYYNNLEDVERRKKLTMLREWRLKDNPTLSRPRPAAPPVDQPTPAPATEDQFVFDSVTDDTASDASRPVLAPRPARTVGPNLFSRSYAPSRGGPGGGHRAYHLPGQAMSASIHIPQVEAQSYSAQPTLALADFDVDYTQDLDKESQGPPQSSTSASEHDPLWSELAAHENQQLYPMGKPFSHRLSQTKSRHYDISGGPLRYQQQVERLLHPEYHDPNAPTSDGEDANSSSTSDSDIAPGTPSQGRTVSTKGTSQRKLHTMASSVPVNITDPLTPYQLAPETRDALINRQIYTSTYLRSGSLIDRQPLSSTLQYGASRKTDDMDGWDPVTGAPESDLTAIVEEDHDPSDSAENPAAVVPSSPTLQPSQGGAHSFIPPHEFAAIISAADPNNMFGSKPADLPRTRMNI
ncbi:hypothetical protein IWQ62_004381 [Dispira parvispora]|uniref:Uncharacterized protein n=1 Tax=Dispira parvispora TaxID=1520584 RepID=A0A9W8E670_9FUNG|nr:hypothetical protein IWQ62_004381 [Dispira parvispora]